MHRSPAEHNGLQPPVAPAASLLSGPAARSADGRPVGPDGDRLAVAGTGEPAGAILDSNGQNLPQTPVQDGSTEGKPSAKGPRWTKQQFRIRAALRESLLLWQADGLLCYFLTLTSAPGSSRDLLRDHWQALRKRIARALDLAPGEVQYRGVDTDEGHGVLHFIIAVPPGPGRSARFLLSVEKLRAWWETLHGARQFNIKPIHNGEGHIRRLSRYVVTQYVAGQNVLGRMSGSRHRLPLARLRQALRQAVFSDPARYIAGQLAYANGRSREDASRLMRSVWWSVYREAWQRLLGRGSTNVWGIEYALWQGELCRV